MFDIGTHFMTGFPGFIATELIKGLIRQGKLKKLYALVQAKERERAKQHIRAIIDEMQVTVQYELIVGDITAPNLGMERELFCRLQQEKMTVWHLAAISDLAVKQETAWEVTVEGTKVVCEFIRKHQGLERFMYFSTAYVAGAREGVLLETELIRPTAFKNYYEQTKFEAELIVQSLQKTTPVTILRPGIVRGHSITGETIKFDGPYFFMNMIDRLKWLPIIPYVGKSQAHINVVPIDYIVDASVYMATLQEAAGHTVHLTDPSPHTVEEVYEAMVVELTGKNPKGRLPQLLAAKGLASRRLQQKLGVEVETLDYLTWNAAFDTSVAERLLANSGIQCADFIHSIPAMAAFYNKHKDDADFHITIE